MLGPDESCQSRSGLASLSHGENRGSTPLGAPVISMTYVYRAVLVSRLCPVEISLTRRIITT
jgi:hypothetical protein